VVIFLNDENPYAGKLIDNPLNAEELNRLLTTAETWKEVRNDFGDEGITRYYPPVDNGAFEIVKSEIFPTMDVSSIKKREEVVDEISIPGKVTQDEYSIGFSSYIDYQRNKDRLTAISVNRVSPNWETIMSTIPAYSLTRKLYLYTGEVTYQENALLRFFINYYLSYEFDYLEQLGYFPPTKQGFLDNPFTIP
jgi:ABC-type phosphate transport system substrate-binding protein